MPLCRTRLGPSLETERSRIQLSAAWALPYARSALPNPKRSASNKKTIKYLGVAQFGSALEWGSRGRKFKSSHSDQYGQLTQLVECLRHMEEVRGSSPLLPTNTKKCRKNPTFFVFLLEKGTRTESVEKGALTWRVFQRLTEVWRKHKYFKRALLEPYERRVPYCPPKNLVDICRRDFFIQTEAEQGLAYHQGLVPCISSRLCRA